MSRPRECRAVRIALTLSRQHGDRAAGFAADRHRRAGRARDATQADLYLAVYAVLANLDGIFDRSRAGG